MLGVQSFSLQPEIAMMLVECCSQERSYLRFYGLLGQVEEESYVIIYIYTDYDVHMTLFIE